MWVKRTPDADLPSSEVARELVPEVLSAYYTTQLGSTFSHYDDELNKKRKKRPPPARAYGTRHNNTPGKAEFSELTSNKRLRSDGDAEGPSQHTCCKQSLA